MQSKVCTFKCRQYFAGFFNGKIHSYRDIWFFSVKNGGLIYLVRILPTLRGLMTVRSGSSRSAVNSMLRLFPMPPRQGQPETNPVLKRQCRHSVEILESLQGSVLSTQAEKSFMKGFSKWTVCRCRQPWTFPKKTRWDLLLTKSSKEKRWKVRSTTSVARQQFQSHQNLPDFEATISNLKKEIERAWKMVEASCNGSNTWSTASHGNFKQLIFHVKL